MNFATTSQICYPYFSIITVPKILLITQNWEKDSIANREHPSHTNEQGSVPGFKCDHGIP